MAIIKSFRDLEVYKRAIVEAKRVFVMSRKFPVEERYSLTDQIRRASRAVGAMVAESWARRRYIAAFINKVNEAHDESMETQAWLDHALACSYINTQEHRDLDGAWQSIGAMLSRMQTRAEDFCRHAR